MVLISILNDTTATQYLYEVDNEIIYCLDCYFDKSEPLMLGGDLYSNDGESEYLVKYLRELAEHNGCTGHDGKWWAAAIKEVRPRELYVETYDFSKHKDE